jgi:hypothetical protein
MRTDDARAMRVIKIMTNGPTPAYRPLICPLIFNCGEAEMLDETSQIETPEVEIASPTPVVQASQARPANGPAPSSDESDIDPNLPPPEPDLDAMLYGLVGDIARAGTAGSEANPVAVALNFITYLSAMVGRDVYLPIGDTFHHCRIFGCHVGRTSEGRKGDAMGIIRRIHRELGKVHSADLLGQIHGGGLSTPEGLIRLIHDGIGKGKNREEAISDKRLLIEEPEFGSTAALRIVWDGGTLAPAIKNGKVSATDPHVAIAAAITPRDLRDLLGEREIANGFVNRFFIIWAERRRLIALPKPLSAELLADLADRVAEVIGFAKGAYPDPETGKNSRAMTLSADAEAFYADMYHNRLNEKEVCPVWNDLLQRRAPMLLRLAMLFAMTDLSLIIEKKHLDAALAWVRYWEHSVRFVFAEHEHLRQATLTDIRAEKLVRHLQDRAGQAISRTDISDKLFAKKLKAVELDGLIHQLLSENPSRIQQIELPRQDGIKGGRSRKLYQAII